MKQIKRAGKKKAVFFQINKQPVRKNPLVSFFSELARSLACPRAPAHYAQGLRMNTEARRAIFCVVAGAEVSEGGRAGGRARAAGPHGLKAPPPHTHTTNHQSPHRFFSNFDLDYILKMKKKRSGRDPRQCFFFLHILNTPPPPPPAPHPPLPRGLRGCAGQAGAPAAGGQAGP